MTAILVHKNRTICILLLVVLSVLATTFCEACKEVRVASTLLGDLTFTSIALDNKEGIDVFSRGRPVYKAYDEKRQTDAFLYHKILGDDGLGRWIVNDKLDTGDQALAYINSWAISPLLLYQVHDRYEWWITDAENNWVIDTSFEVSCVGEGGGDNTFFFEGSALQPGTAGFYLERQLTSSDNSMKTPVFTKVVTAEDDAPMYFFKFENKWMVGSNYGEDACFAYVEDKALLPAEITNTSWMFISTAADDHFVPDHNEIIHKDMAIAGTDEKGFASVYEALRYYRSVKFVPEGQMYATLRNSVPMPQIGLGTGGIDGNNMVEVISQALIAGYRFLDLAQEYGNEELIPEVFARIHEEGPDASIYRNDIFIQSKVWPTHLGYQTTYDQILKSMTSLTVSFIDSYLLHWPFCDADTEWMHCEDIVDKDGTWQASWNALQRAYSEGIVNSIGVSNFNIELLQELEANPSAVVFPHIIQNFADFTNLDLEVRAWCEKTSTVYQPYASGRNINFLPDEIKSTVQDIANQYPGQSPYSVALRFFIQSGAAVIPRSNSKDHLADNLKAFGWSLSEQHMEQLGWPTKPRAEL